MVFQHAFALDEHHGHGLTEVFAGGAEHFLTTAAVELHGNGRLAVLHGRTGVGQLVARQDEFALEQHRLAAAVVVELGADGRTAGALCFDGAVDRVAEAELEGGDLAENANDLGSVLHARQLHRNAGLTLPLHHRLGDAEAVNAVIQGSDVLLDGEVLAGLDLRRRQQRR